MNFLLGLFITLWTLLFVIPGMIKSYSYSMTPYILYENKEMTAKEAITQSRKMMKGNKWRLFCLSFSFIGWDILCAIPFFVMLIIAGVLGTITGNIVLAGVVVVLSFPISFFGNMFLRAYKEAAYAAFYREISNTNPVIEENIIEA